MTFKKKALRLSFPRHKPVDGTNPNDKEPQCQLHLSKVKIEAAPIDLRYPNASAISNEELVVWIPGIPKNEKDCC